MLLTPEQAKIVIDSALEHVAKDINAKTDGGVTPKGVQRLLDTSADESIRRRFLSYVSLGAAMFGMTVNDL